MFLRILRNAALPHERHQLAQGYAMVALLVMLSVMSILLTVALPAWRQMVQREKEAELIFRGEQYARAIALYQRKYAGAFPPSIDLLVEQRFLRKKYKDPITGDDFQVLYASQAAPTPSSPESAATPGQRGTSVTRRSSAESRARAGAPSRSTLSSFTASPTTSPGGIIGVASKSKAESIRIYNGRNHYNEWHFVYTPVTQQPGPTPGTVGPGQVPGPQRGPASTPGLRGTSPPLPPPVRR